VQLVLLVQLELLEQWVQLELLEQWVQPELLEQWVQLELLELLGPQQQSMRLMIQQQLRCILSWWVLLVQIKHQR
jgi:hypothetical protein